MTTQRRHHRAHLFKTDCPEWCTVDKYHVTHEGFHRQWEGGRVESGVHNDVTVQALAEQTGTTGPALAGITLIDHRTLKQQTVVLSWPAMRELGLHLLTLCDTFAPVVSASEGPALPQFDQDPEGRPL